MANQNKRSKGKERGNLRHNKIVPQAHGSQVAKSGWNKRMALLWCRVERMSSLSPILH